MSFKPLRVVVIGGGAAGFFGAITCAAAHPHTQVTLLEAGRQPLSKVRISGGGRCNVTHACFEPASLIAYYPRGAKALRGAFSRFQSKDTVAWFESHGVQLKTEADGRMFPVTDSSETVVNCLVTAAEDAGVKLRTSTAVKSIWRLSTLDSRASTGASPLLPTQGNFEIELKTGEILECDRILLATGSNPQGYRWAVGLGHTVEPPVPSLFTFNIQDPRLQDLAGVSLDNVHLRLPEAPPTLREQTGPLLITHWGLSGPAILKLSAWGARFLHDQHYQTPLLINWLPQYSQDNLRQMLLAVKSQLPRRQILTSCPVPVPKRLWKTLVTSVGISTEERWAEVSKKALNQLVQE
ncbi:MAG TPA: aminoacetone oxidase family FAD-binding enzyme, partial [Oculatellaceae cyanobacterium]